MEEFAEAMEVLSKFVENTKDILFDTHTTVPELAKAIGKTEGATYWYLRGHTPGVETLVKIADFFNCSLEFLLGREPERQHGAFLPCPPWKEQVAFLLAHFKVSKYRLCKDVPVTRSVFYAWLKGAEPELNYILRLADFFGCTVDFVLGREK